MRLPKQDNGKPIKVGDPGFLYKGVFHPIEWRGEVPYRVRGEVLVIKEDKLFLRYYKDSTREYCYRLPGGSLDLDATPMEQARNEVNEEALIDVENLADTNIQYVEMYPEGFLLKKGDICIAYKGCNTRVYIANYSGRVDKRKIEEHDLDNDMSKHGKFYPISIIYKILRKEHLEALLNSSLVSEEDKTIIRDHMTSSTDKSIDLNINKLFYATVYALPPSMWLSPTVDKYNDILTMNNLGDTTTKRISLYGKILSAVQRLNNPSNKNIQICTPMFLDVNNLVSPTEQHIHESGMDDERWYTSKLSFETVGVIEPMRPEDTEIIWVERKNEQLISALESLSIVTEAEDDPEEDDDIEDYGEDLEEEDAPDDTPDEDDDISDYEDDEDIPDEDDDVSDYEDGEEPQDETDGDDTPPPIDDDDDSMDYSDETDGDTDEESPDTTDEDSETDIETQDDESGENSNLKNYNLMKDFGRIFYLVSDVLKRLDNMLFPTPMQNSVVSQVTRNITAIKTTIIQYIKFKFSSSTYATNLYHYNIIIQAIKINLEMLNKIQHLDTDSKQIDKK